MFPLWATDREVTEVYLEENFLVRFPSNILLVQPTLTAAWVKPLPLAEANISSRDLSRIELIDSCVCPPLIAAHLWIIASESDRCRAKEICLSQYLIMRLLLIFQNGSAYLAQSLMRSIVPSLNLPEVSRTIGKKFIPLRLAWVAYFFSFSEML